MGTPTQRPATGSGGNAITPRAPDFLCIGAQKAATAWLRSNLSAHPGIKLPFAKELHYFDSRTHGDRNFFLPLLQKRLAKKIEQARARGAPEAHLAHMRRLGDPDRILTLDWYLDAFALVPPRKITGEFTPRYAAMPEDMMDELFALAPRVKLIYIIRDPFDRALSSFRMEVARQAIDPENRTAMDDFAAYWLRRSGKQQSNYACFIPRWDARTVEGETMLYLPFGDVKTDPDAVLRRVEAFLGLTEGPAQSRARNKFNRTAPIAVPNWLVEQLREDMAPHLKFLQDRFSRDFVDRIR
ncbi:MAG: sulfotransferase [Pseudomonadota bacterium]